MATKNDDLGRRVDLLNDTGSADRAKRINSLHRTVSDLERQSNEKKIDYSKEINSLSNEQRRMLQKLESERDAFTHDTMESYNTVVKGLGSTINRLATGIKYITTETAKATKDAIGQYARAVGQDVSINKQNTVAMALSTASPLFGYFASKFMETDVFKNAASRIRQNVGNAISSGFSRLIGRKKEYEDDIPSMQRGGYVKKGGMIKVHAAEVVMPAEKVMQQIDKAKNTAIARQMGTTMTDMSDTLEDIQEEVSESQEKTGNIIDTFFREYNAVKDEQSFVGDTIQHVVAELKEIKEEMFGTAETWGMVFERTLNKHPVFKFVHRAFKFFDSTLPGVFTWAFGKKSKYANDVARAAKTKNVYDRIVGVTGLLYEGMMPRLDTLIKYSKELTEFTTGKKITEPKEKFEKSRFEEMISWFKKKDKKKDKKSFLQSMFDMTAEKGGVEDELKKAGIKSFKDFLRPREVLKKAGVKDEDIHRKVNKVTGFFKIFKNVKDFIFGLKKKDTEGFVNKAKDFFETAGETLKDIKDKISTVAQAEVAREEREGPHSPSMSDNIASTAEITKEEAKRQKESDEKQLNVLEKTQKSVKGLGESINKFAKDAVKKFGDWIMYLLMFLPNILGTVVTTAFSLLRGMFGGVLDAILTVLPGRRLLGRTIFKMGGKKLGKDILRGGRKKGLGKMAGEAFKDVKEAKGIKGMARATGEGIGKVGATAFGRGVSAIGEAATKVGGVLKGGVKETAKFGGRMVAGAGKAVGGIGLGGAKLAGKIGMGALKLGGRMVASIPFAAYELFDSILEGVSGFRNPEEFAASRMASGIGAFLGGKDSGWSGAASGALKWGSVGAVAGQIAIPIPGVGAAIGGGIGALLGSIVGFVGGKNIAQGIDWLADAVSPILKGAWEVFKFPFQAFWELTKSFWVLIKWGWKNTVGKAYTFVSEKVAEGWNNLSNKVSEWWNEEGEISRIYKSGMSELDKIGERYKVAWAETTGALGRVWDGITNFTSKAKDFMIDKLSALGPVWNWLKEWIVEPVTTSIGALGEGMAYGISSIREGKVADDLERFLNEENPVREMGDPKKQLMSEIAEASAEAHRANSEATLQAMKQSAEETTEAITRAGKETKESTENSMTQINNVWKSWANSQTGGGGGKYSTPVAGSSYSDRVMFGGMM
jgi:hypothetical protein